MCLVRPRRARNGPGHDGVADRAPDGSRRALMDDQAWTRRVDAGVAGQRRGRRRLTALAAAAILLPAAILATAAWSAWRGAWAEAGRELARGADQSAEFLRRLFDRQGRAAVAIADQVAGLDDDALRAAAPELRLVTARLVSKLGLVRAARVLGGGGQALVLAGEAVAEPPGGFAAMLREASPGRLVVGPTYRPEGSDAAFFPVGLRPGGEARAVVLLLDATQLGVRLAGYLGEGQDSAMLVRADGEVLARHPRAVLPAPRLAPDRPVMRAFAAGIERGALPGVGSRDAKPVAIAFRRIEGMPDLAVAVGRRRHRIVEHWRAALLPLIGIGAPAILALLGLALVVRRQHAALETALMGLEERVAERTASLREGEERLRVAIEAGRFGTWETDARTGLTRRSPRAQEIFGFPPEMLSSPPSDWSSRIHPSDRARVVGAWDRALAGANDGYREEYRFQRPDGTWRWLESSAAVVRSDPATGRPLLLAGTIQDFTERHEAEDRRELLTQEVNHRARNALAIVQAILRLTRADSTAQFARLVEGRVAALARAQALLAAERWTGAPLHALLGDEIAPFGGSAEAGSTGGGRFRLDGPRLRVRAEAVQPLGMVFHELATNAAKHGALSVPQGRVSVSWQVDAAAGALRIRWAETSGPPPGLPKHRGVGSRVIEATVAGQLAGSLERRWPAEGLVCDISLPLARTVAGPA